MDTYSGDDQQVVADHKLAPLHNSIDNSPYLRSQIEIYKSSRICKLTRNMVLIIIRVQVGTCHLSIIVQCMVDLGYTYQYLESLIWPSFISHAVR